MTNYYTVDIEKVGQCNPETNDTKLRFNVFSSATNPDGNNNVKTTFLQTLASFEFLEDEIQSIRVAPTVSNKFNVEFTKYPGAKSPKPSKSTSVQFIHRRNGKFLDSNENIVPILLHTVTNLLPEDNLPKISTFSVVKKNESSRKECIDLQDVEDADQLAGPIITETDLIYFSRFQFTFNPWIETLPGPCFSDGPQPSPEENCVDKPIDETPTEVDFDATTDDMNNNVGVVSLEQLIKEPNQQASTSVPFKTVFDNVISITIEMRNLMFQKRREACLMKNDTSIASDDSIEDQASSPESMNNLNKRKYSEEVAKSQCLSKNVINKKHEVAQTINANRITTLRNFVKSMVVQRLQSLGVQELDCNEILDSWQARQLRSNWYHTWPDEYSGGENVDLDGIISPYVSKPNSSLFRLTPSGHISRSIFSTFVHQVDSLKAIVNNATCTLIQTSIHLLLPEIKLLCARQLETNNNPIFIQEWIRLMMLAAKQLKPSTPDDVAIMINRELKALKCLSKKLHKSTKKIFHKIGKLSKYSEEVFRKTLVRLHPKSLQWVNAFDRALKKCYAPDVIHYDPSKLHNINTTTGDLFKDHVFLSETDKGELLVKNDIDGCWDKFLDLEFSERRGIFLALTEDLQSTLRRSLNEVQHLQEIYTIGYPGSIKKLLEDVVDELKFTSKRDDLTLLIKTSIVTHIIYLHETLTRLFCICEETDGITKNFDQTIQNVSLNASKIKKYEIKNQKKNLLSEKSTRNSNATGIKGYHTEYTAGIQHSRPLLAIPLSHVNEIFKNSTHT